MVAVLLRLRFRVLANTLARNPIQLVAVILGGLQALGLGALAVFALVLLGNNLGPEVVNTFVVIGGTALLLGWLIVPILFDGVEHTLDPLKLAPFPLRPGQLMAAMMIVGVAWFPGVVTIVVSMASGLAFRNTPGIAAIAVVCGALGALGCIAGSRMIASLTGNLLAGRRLRIRVSVLVAIAIVLVGPLAVALIVGLSSRANGFSAVAGVLGWTPLGAVWSIPEHIALGDTAAAVGASVIAIGTLAAILVVWRLSISASLRHRGGVAARSVAAGRLGVFGVVPESPAGAIAARSLVYWFRDARYARQLLIVPALPILLVLWARLIGVEGIAIAAGPIVGALLPLAIFAGISFDGTAFAAHIAAGVRGIDDRIGRVAAIAVIAIPSVIAVQLLIAGVLDLWPSLPALLGMSLGMLFTALGVVSVSSARIVIPVPRATRNPFSAAAGSGMTAVLGSYAVTGITGALALPELALGVVSITLGLTWLGVIALAVGLVLGGVLAVVGIRVGGAVYDRSAPALLARLKVIQA